jgi:hypothetical protein
VIEDLGVDGVTFDRVNAVEDTTLGFVGFPDRDDLAVAGLEPKPELAGRSV